MKKFFLFLTLLTLSVGQMWGANYNQTIDYSGLGDMLGGSYTDASSYWKVPTSSGNSGTVTIPSTYFANQPSGNVTLTLNIATFGSGTNPSTSNVTITARGTENNTNWTSSSYSGNLPSSNSYTNITLTLTRPNNPTQLGGVQITLGVNTGVKIFRLKQITVAYQYTQETTYSVTYNNGGHGTAPSNTTAASVTLQELTETGYTCTGWKANQTVKVNNSNVSANTLINNGTTATLLQATTFTAQWSANKYTITLNNQSATTAGTASIQATYNASTNLTSAINVPEKTGWTFGGYFTQVGGAGTQIIDASGNVLASKTGYTDSYKKWIKAEGVTLYAKWTRTVTWSVNNNTTVYSAQTVTFNTASSKVSSVPSPNPSDYCGDKFVGWSLKNAGNESKTTSYYDDLFTTVADSPNLNSITADVIFYAVFADYAN